MIYPAKNVENSWLPYLASLALSPAPSKEISTEAHFLQMQQGQFTTNVSPSGLCCFSSANSRNSSYRSQIRTILAHLRIHVSDEIFDHQLIFACNPETETRANPYSKWLRTSCGSQSTLSLGRFFDTAMRTKKPMALFRNISPSETLQLVLRPRTPTRSFSSFLGPKWSFVFTR